MELTGWNFMYFIWAINPFVLGLASSNAKKRIRDPRGNDERQPFTTAM